MDSSNELKFLSVSIGFLESQLSNNLKVCVLIKDILTEYINICDVLTSDVTKFNDLDYLVKINTINGTVKSIFVEETFKVIEEMQYFSENLDLVNFDCSKS